MQTDLSRNPIISKFIKYLENLPSTSKNEDEFLGQTLCLTYLCQKKFAIEIDFGDNWIYENLYRLYKNLHDNPTLCKKEIQSFTIALYHNKDDYDPGYQKATIYHDQPEFEELTLSHANALKPFLDDFFYFLLVLIEDEDERFKIYKQHMRNMPVHAFVFLQNTLQYLDIEDSLLEEQPDMFTFLGCMCKTVNNENVYEWFKRSQNVFYILHFLNKPTYVQEITDGDM